MLDINLLRRDLDQVVNRLQARKSPQPYLDVAAFQALENERKTLQSHTENLQARRNTLSKQVGQLKAKGESADAVMAEVASIKTDLEQSALRLDALQSELQTFAGGAQPASRGSAPRCRRARQCGVASLEPARA